MDKKFYQGHLKRWNDDRGFGFIAVNNEKEEIFLHISALKRMNRRPVIGDVILYQIHIDNDGKKRAINAKIEGVKEIQPRTKSRASNKQYDYSLVTYLVVICLVILIGVIFYRNFYPQKINFDTPETILIAPSKQANFKCSGKIYCSDMTSCDEATFYLKNCPGTKMDGDGDGIPCEDQWCGH